MPNLDEQQPTEPTTPAPPSDAKDWKAEYEKVLRQYNGAQGVIKTRTDERDKALSDLNALSTEYEGFKQEKNTEIQGLSQIQTQHAELQGTHTKTAKELAAIKFAATEFPENPELVRYIAKGMLQPGEREGDDLRTFLTDWKTEFESLGADAGRNRASGSIPPAPGNAAPPAMTLFEVQDKKVEALKRSGVKSKEYLELQALERQLLQNPSNS